MRTAPVIIIALSLVNTNLSAQNNNAVRNTLYAGFASKGAVYSINYDRVFSQGEKFTKSYHVGFAIFRDVLAIPLGINFFSGQHTHHAEFSVTLVPYIEHYQKLFSPGSLSDKKIYILPGAGYRYQKRSGGFFFKALFSPVIYLDPASDNFWRMDAKLYPGVAAGMGISF